MEVTDGHILRWNKSKILTINLHHVFSTLTVDDPEVFNNFVRKNLIVNTQQTIDVITNVVEYFGYLLVVNDRDIDTFVKDTNFVNKTRATA